MKKRIVIYVLLTLGITLIIYYMKKRFSLKGRLIYNARKELVKWKGKKETDKSVSQYLIKYWKSVGKRFTKEDMQSSSTHSSYPWSAAFISFLFYISGAKSFPFSASHSGYFLKAKKNRSIPSAELIGYRLDEYKPEVGDLIVYTGQNGKGYDSDGFFPSHGELIISKESNSVCAIGGNVSNTVKLSRYTLMNGYLTKNEKPFFMVIKNNLNQIL